jgi:hypothetical protein
MDEAQDEEALATPLNALPQGPQVTDLTHALALIKGELSMRDAEVPYITIHRGLQALWTGLGNLEAGHNKQGVTLHFCQDRVDHLVTDTWAAWGRSNKAMHAVE